MAQQKGSTVTIQLGWESTYATAPSAGFVLPINSFNPNFSQNVQTPATLTGTRNPVEPFRGNWESTFDITVPVDSIAFRYWLKALFNDPTTTGTDPYTHEYKVVDSQPSFTLEVAAEDLTTNQYFQYLGCKLGSMAMSVGGDGELVATFSGVGSYLNIATSSFDASPTTVSMARLDNFEAAMTEGGSALSNATELSVNVDMGLDPVRVIGGDGRVGAINEGIVGVSGSLSTLFEDVSLYTKATAGTESAIVLTITGGSSSILVIEIQELQYGVSSPTVDGPQGMLVNLNYQGYYTNGSEASAIVARITNGESS